MGRKSLKNRRWALFAGRPQAPCHWCGRYLSFRRATLDHVLPAGHGGGNARDNLVIACAPCNNQRGDLPYDEYREVVNMRRLGMLTPVGAADEARRRISARARRIAAAEAAAQAEVGL